MSSTVTSPIQVQPDTTSPSDQSEWFRQEVHAHDGQLKAYLRSSFPSVRDVDDIVQESYLRVWRRQSLQPITTAKAFLFTVARRLSIDWIRRARPSVIVPMEDLAALAVLENGNSAVDAVAAGEMIALLTEAVDALPTRCREVVIMRKFKLLSTRETALKLNLKEPTVEMQLSRGNTRIRAYLAARGINSVLGHDA